MDELHVDYWVAAMPEKVLRVARSLPAWHTWEARNAVHPTLADAVREFQARPASS